MPESISQCFYLIVKFFCLKGEAPIVMPDFVNDVDRECAAGCHGMLAGVQAHYLLYASIQGSMSILPLMRKGRPYHHGM